MRLKLNIISGELIKEEYKLFDVSPGDVERFWFPYYPYGIIKGIKVIGTAGVMGFNVSVFTDETEKNPIYYSGSVNTILWDIMDIPVIDETGMERVFISFSHGDLSFSHFKSTKRTV